MAIKKYCIEGELYSANAIQKELKRILNDTPLEKEVQGKDLTFVLQENVQSRTRKRRCD